MRELLARVKSLLRRAQMPAARPDAADQRAAGSQSNGRYTAAEETKRLVVGDLVIDSARRQASLGSVVLTLKPKEFDLLYYIARHPGIVLSRDALLREVWGYDFPVDTRTVDVHVSWLRQKIEEDPSQPRRIETVRGHGYRFVPEPT
jgi:DNA-binding response OmpR family regulator